MSLEADEDERYAWPCCDGMRALAAAGDASVRTDPGMDYQRPGLHLVHSRWQSLQECPCCGESYVDREPTADSEQEARNAR